MIGMMRGMSSTGIHGIALANQPTLQHASEAFDGGKHDP
jgi:hypothetical protein